VNAPLIIEAEQIPFRALHNLPLVSFCRPNSWRDSLEQRARKLGIQLNIVFEADSFAVQLGIVERSGAYALLGRYAIESALAQGRIRAAKLSRPSMARSIGLAHAKTGSLTPAMKAVMQVAQSITLG
jgi:DNA-binding transcriptional LysR family regulator